MIFFNIFFIFCCANNIPTYFTQILKIIVFSYIKKKTDYKGVSLLEVLNKILKTGFYFKDFIPFLYVEKLVK